MLKNTSGHTFSASRIHEKLTITGGENKQLCGKSLTGVETDMDWSLDSCQPLLSHNSLSGEVYPKYTITRMLHISVLSGQLEMSTIGISIRQVDIHSSGINQPSVIGVCFIAFYLTCPSLLVCVCVSYLSHIDMPRQWHNFNNTSTQNARPNITSCLD